MRFALVLLLVLVPTASAQTLIHVRVTDDDASALATELENAGYDVVEGSIASDSFELVVGDLELAAVRDMGLSVELIARGRPFREIQDESGSADMVPAGYMDLAAITAQMTATAAAFPGICRLVDLSAELGAPLTAEGRSIMAMRITDNPNIEENEAAFLLVSAHHCRELVTPVIALEAIDQLTQSYGVDGRITALVNNSDIWIIPVFNPDGYEYVFSTDNLWRKNRRVLPGGVGVDLNRNYPFGWSSACAGSTSVTSLTYKGPSPASEAETQTMMMLTEAQSFARVIDFHSSGQEVLWGYDCSTNVYPAFWLAEGIALSVECGYGGAERPPSAEGEHYEWQLARGAHAFLVETATQFQPTFAAAQAEAVQVWDGVQWLLTRRAALTGLATDFCTDEPIEASITLAGTSFPNGETVTSEPLFGRYDLFTPSGNDDVTWSAAGYSPVTLPEVFRATTAVEDVALDVIATTTTAGTAAIGTQTQVQFHSLSDVGWVYGGVMTLSGTSPGVPVGNCTLPINVDTTTFLPWKDSGFQSFVGFLDMNGDATGTITIPADIAFVGVEVDFAFMTIEFGTINVRHVSTADHLTIVP